MRASKQVVVLVVCVAGCGPWGRLPDDGYVTLDEALWDDRLLAAQDGLYVRLPRAGSLVRLSGEGEVEEVDLLGASAVSLSVAPDGRTVVVFDRWPVCDVDDPEVTTESECEEVGGLVEWRRGLALVQDGGMAHEEEVPAIFNRLAFAPYLEGRSPLGVAYLDYTEGPIEVEGVVNLTEVLFVDLESGATTRLSVGSSASAVLFTSDGGRAVVLSRSQVVVVDIGTEPYEATTTFPLTLDADQAVDALGAALTPDDRYLLMSVVGRADLYVMDLEGEAINIVDLASAPAAMVVDEPSDRTVLVYADRAQADLVDHAYFDVETVDLDEPCTALVPAGDGVVLAYNDRASTYDVYRLDVGTGQATEYRVPNPVTELQVAPGGAWAVALQRDEWTGTGSPLDAAYDAHWMASLLDLSGDDQVDLLLGSEPMGLAFTEGDTGRPYALLLLKGLDALVQVDLWSAEDSEIALPAPATGIGATADGRFWIAHDRALGLVTLLDPEEGTMTHIWGFADRGLFPDDTLPRTGEE